MEADQLLPVVSDHKRLLLLWSQHNHNTNTICFEVDHSFYKYGSIHILPTLFKAIHRTEERFIETGDKAGRIIGVEECLSGSIDIGGIAFVTSS